MRQKAVSCSLTKHLPWPLISRLPSFNLLSASKNNIYVSFSKDCLNSRHPHTIAPNASCCIYCNFTTTDVAHFSHVRHMLTNAVALIRTQDDGHRGGTSRNDAATDARQPPTAKQISIKSGLHATLLLKTSAQNMMTRRQQRMRKNIRHAVECSRSAAGHARVPSAAISWRHHTPRCPVQLKHSP
jgi:hypothetical protein